jgi:hypothetical protein
MVATVTPIRGAEPGGCVRIKIYEFITCFTPTHSDSLRHHRKAHPRTNGNWRAKPIPGPKISTTAALSWTDQRSRFSLHGFTPQRTSTRPGAQAPALTKLVCMGGITVLINDLDVVCRMKGKCWPSRWMQTSTSSWQGHVCSS